MLVTIVGRSVCRRPARQTEKVLTNLQSDRPRVSENLTTRQSDLRRQQPFSQQTPPRSFSLPRNGNHPKEHIRDGAGNLIVAKVTNPTLTSFVPQGNNTNKAAVIICPGGGYTNLHIHGKGSKWLMFHRAGVAALVLKYRLPDEEIVEDKAHTA